MSAMLSQFHHPTVLSTLKELDETKIKTGTTYSKKFNNYLKTLDNIQ